MEPWRLFDFDQTHILTAAFVYNFPRNWEIGGTFRRVGDPLPEVFTVGVCSGGNYPHLQKFLRPIEQWDTLTEKPCRHTGSLQHFMEMTQQTKTGNVSTGVYGTFHPRA